MRNFWVWVENNGGEWIFVRAKFEFRKFEFQGGKLVPRKYVSDVRGEKCFRLVVLASKKVQK